MITAPTPEGSKKIGGHDLLKEPLDTEKLVSKSRGTNNRILDIQTPKTGQDPQLIEALKGLKRRAAS